MSKIPYVSYLDMPSHLVPISKHEALRYLGYRREAAEDTILDKLSALESALRCHMTCRACWLSLPICRREEGLYLGDLLVESRDLAINLKDCRQVILFAATLGVGVDRLIGRNSRISSSDGLMTDALASAAIEGFCDELETKLCAGQPHRPRFSPGYGDLLLDYQKTLIDMTDASRRIGLTLTESLMMVPAKSVTAIIGIR